MYLWRNSISILLSCSGNSGTWGADRWNFWVCHTLWVLNFYPDLWNTTCIPTHSQETEPVWGAPPHRLVPTGDLLRCNSCWTDQPQSAAQTLVITVQDTPGHPQLPRCCHGKGAGTDGLNFNPFGRQWCALGHLRQHLNLHLGNIIEQLNIWWIVLISKWNPTFLLAFCKNIKEDTAT